MPIVVIYGDEDYLKEQEAHKLRSAIVDPAMAGLTHRIFNNPSLANTLEAVGSISLALGGQTLIEIRNFAFLHEAAKDGSTEAQLEELKVILENLEPTKTVLFYCDKVDGKIKFAKWLLKHPGVQVYKFEQFKFWETAKAMDFLVHLASSRGLRLSDDAAELLVNSLGTELRPLINELDKLELIAPNKTITRQEVLSVCSHSENLFQLINRWILKQYPDQNYHDLHEILFKRHPIEIFALIQSYFNNIFRTCWLHHHRVPMHLIAEQTGQKPFKVKKDLELFGRVPLDRWLKLKELLVELEWKSKTGQLTGQLALEILLGA